MRELDPGCALPPTGGHQVTALFAATGVQLQAIVCAYAIGTPLQGGRLCNSGL